MWPSHSHSTCWIRAHSPRLFVFACFVSSFTSGTVTTSRLRVRGLEEYRNLETKRYQNPCTGSWSNDIEVLSISNCDDYNQGDSGLSGGSSRGSEDCSIQTKDDPESPVVSHLVEFWYCVETDDMTSKNFQWLPVLEEKIYNVATDRINWCLGYTAVRSLLVATDESSQSRRLGILNATSSPKDVIRFDVPYQDDCFVVQGGLTIEARQSDDVDNLVQSVIASIQAAMDNDKLLNDAIPEATRNLADDAVPKVTDVTFLGISQADVENANIVPISDGSTKSVDTEDDDNNAGLIAGVCTSVLLVLVALLLLLYRKRRRDESKDRFLALEDDGKSFKSLIGTGDPPGSFHHGVHHYFRDGQNYLSTNCYDCHETRLLSNSDYGGILPATIDKDAIEDPYIEKFVVSDAKGIRNEHSGIDVHKCTSSTCNSCLTRPKRELKIVKVDRNRRSRSHDLIYEDNQGVAHATYDL